MGSYQATDLGLANLGKFGYVGAFSGGTDINLYSNRNKINDSVVVLFNGYGTSDELSLGQTFESSLNTSRINHVTAKFPGGHEWQVWRNCLHQFASLLFKPYTYEHPLSVKTINSQTTFSVYPNPFKVQIHLQFDSDLDTEDARYELNDLTGKQILSFTGIKSNAELKISRTLLSSSGGLYVLSVYTQKGVFQGKIIK